MLDGRSWLKNFKSKPILQLEIVFSPLLSFLISELLLLVSEKTLSPNNGFQTSWNNKFLLLKELPHWPYLLMKVKRLNGKMKDFLMIPCQLKMLQLLQMLLDGLLLLIHNCKDLFGLNKHLMETLLLLILTKRTGSVNLLMLLVSGNSSC
jgi:hypothetical protein